jgi:hypothetical protein
MCECQKFQCATIIREPNKSISVCVCGHPLRDHNIGLFRESCKGVF